MAVAKPNKKKYKPNKYPVVTQEVIDNILKDLEEGSTNKRAARANGVSESHFYNLIAQGIVDIEFGMPDTMQARMVVSLSKLEQNEIKWCRKSIKESDKGHRGAEWTLEHAYWRDFSPNANVKELADDIEQLRLKHQAAKGDLDGDSHSSKKEKDPEK